MCKTGVCPEYARHQLAISTWPPTAFGNELDKERKMTTNLITIGAVTIQQDDDGRYSLNDLHRASGGENRHRPSLWSDNQQIKDLIDEIESEAGIPALVSQHGGLSKGTYVCKVNWFTPSRHVDQP